jgi:hypothetical protein
MESGPVRRREPREVQLSQRVYHFINEAQANYRRFFSPHAPDPWQLVLERLTDPSAKTPQTLELQKSLDGLQGKHELIESSGLRDQEWGLTWIKAYLSKMQSQDDSANAHAQTVLGTYLELLETRVNQQLLLAERLSTFERLLSEFFAGKTVRVDEESGFIIETSNKQRLHEAQLSSGEYHLLYLMVRALVARRRGTVIAIDEPELSMHISWQRRLVGALCDCAAGGEPQFLLATHSPDIARDYSDTMVRLGGEVE